MSAVAVYLREEKVVVIPQGGGGGHFMDIEPILVVLPREEEVQDAVMESIKVSIDSPYVEELPKSWKTPVLKHLGVKSYKAFIKGAKLCFVFEDNGALEVERWKLAPDGRGFEQAPEGAQALSDESEMGAMVLQALNKV